MYQITYNKGSQHLEIESQEKGLYAKLHLNEGGSLQRLTLKGHTIIQDLSPLNYATTYASSILFPFANRIKDGAYVFKGKMFQLEINQKDEHNALHGLVYNKTFTVVDTKIEAGSAIILLEYNETKPSVGFPYTYKIQLGYHFNETGMALKVTVKNTATEAFPFTLGWHPYFVSDNLFDSAIVMDSTQKIVMGERNITTDVTETNTKKPLKIEGQSLDDCWVLNSDEVLFKTPKYNLQFNATGEDNFLQVYTPPKANTIAIEPTTGVSDSFNNKIGLQVLRPNDEYDIKWQIKIEEQ